MANVNSDFVANYYDQFSEDQIKTGINLRHYVLAKLLKDNVKKSTNILEIGCGIGTFTKLISKLFKNARITGLDISKENVRIAGERLKNLRFSFIQRDLGEPVDFSEKYDLIILADVMEHIPSEKYNMLFRNIANACKEGASVFINIPHPHIIEYTRKNKPELLQVIDQSVYQKLFFETLVNNDFEIVKMEDYKLFHEQNDYVYYFLRYKQSINMTFQKKSFICNTLKKWRIKLSI